MSYRVTVEIVCDHESCRSLWKDYRINSGGVSKTWAGNVAAGSDGWYVRGFPGPADPKVAYCPEHRAEHGHPAPA